MDRDKEPDTEEDGEIEEKRYPSAMLKVIESELAGAEETHLRLQELLSVRNRLKKEFEEAKMVLEEQFKMKMSETDSEYENSTRSLEDWVFSNTLRGQRDQLLSLEREFMTANWMRKT